MKHFICLLVLMGLCAAITACSSNKKSEPIYRKKIYLTEQDYLDDLGEKPYMERRQAKPNPESNYVFNIQPETQKNVYFFDERVRPMVPGVPTDREYKNTKRLWNKPRRYAPEQYYGEESGGDNNAGASEDSSSSYDDDMDYE